MSACFHCGEPVPTGSEISVAIDGQPRPMCCQGCAAVAELLSAGDMTGFYRARDGLSSRPDPHRHEWWLPFDRGPVLEACAEALEDNHYRTQLRVSNLRCAACVWLIEKVLEAESGVTTMTVNPATGLADLHWNQQATPLSRVLQRLDALGYPSRPAEASAQERPAEERAAMRRLLVAGIGMLQVMTYAVGLYLGDFGDMQLATRDYLRWIALLVTTPVVFYSGWPFFAGAWRCLRLRRLTMELPIGLAIAIAWSASLINTFRGQGDVYFDSAVMFVFFMTVVRLVELRSRHRALNLSEKMAADLPTVVRRLENNQIQLVARTELQPGDRVRVETGEQVPADGRLVGGRAALDESLLTGESRAQLRSEGDRVLAGSLVVEGPATFQITRVNRDTMLSAIARLMRQAAAQRTTGSEWMTRIASIFLGGILLLTVATFLFWWQYQPDRALDVVLALLVVTCPCALSLAIPVAQAATQARLAAGGILLARPGVLEDISRIDYLVTDKTGTLTEGQPVIQSVQVLGDLDEARILAVCSALEAVSSHPIARAFKAADQPDSMLTAEDVREFTGQGIEGWVNGVRYRLGRSDFACRTHEDRIGLGGSGLMLANDAGPVAWIRLQDAIREDAAPTLAGLGWPVTILSGDHEAAVAATAGELGLHEWRAQIEPAEKLACVRRLQAAGRRVLAVGDGINDAPLLAGADIGVAMGVAGALARTRADVIVPGPRLSALLDLQAAGLKARTVIRQNLIWALLYNLIAIPAAVAGLVPPWLAAAGMSLSSLGVVLNSLRLLRPVKSLTQIQPAGVKAVDRQTARAMETPA